MACPTTVHDQVCVGASVTIAPQVDVGDIQSFCVGDPFIGSCPGIPAPSCSFNVSQRICVQVPLLFHATATVEPTGIICDDAQTGLCGTPTVCTHTIGYYLNHLTEVGQLITVAGGSIVLGSNSTGLSYTVTTAVEAEAVLSLNTPAPPAPDSPPYAGQYQILYAQLLAANLNVLNGATCTFATDAITAANSFLAMSPPGGMDGAPALQDALAQFNQGNAPNCPLHCSE